MSYYRGERENEYGTPVAVFECHHCQTEFTICPSPKEDKRAVFERDGCGDAECDTYDPRRDANVLFGDYTMFNRYCERKGLDPRKLSHELMPGGAERLQAERLQSREEG